MTFILNAPYISRVVGKTEGQGYQLYNFSSYEATVSEFSIKKINFSEIAQYAPKEVTQNIKNTGTENFFLISAPTQNTAGYIFEISRHKNHLTACLRKPLKDQAVLMVVTNPAAVLISQGNLKVFISKDYCRSN